MSTVLFGSLKTGQEWVAEAPPRAQLHRLGSRGVSFGRTSGSLGLQ